MSEQLMDGVRRALDGVFASVLATCDADGVPNVSMISQVHYVDPTRVALSYQFFNKTRRNILATGRAAVQITDAVTMAHHRLELEYEETQTSGALFESMKAKLAGIASHHGMDGVFRLLGADIFRVRAIEAVPGPVFPCREPDGSLLAATRRACAALDRAEDLDELFDAVTAALEREFGIEYSMVLMLEPEAERLYAVATRGYPTSGIGAEVLLGEGIIGVAARENTPIRIGHMTREYSYGAAISETARRVGLVGEGAVGIPFPGLGAPRSQIALPIKGCGRPAGILFAEAEETMRFGYEEEDAMALVAMHLGARMALLQLEEDVDDVTDAPKEPSPAGHVTMRFFAVDQSVFFGHDYLIKGVAGLILWRLVSEHLKTGRTEFTTRELRLDPSLRLPSHAENLDARLVLLRKRLEERKACVRLEKAGRGRFRLVANCRISLEEDGA
ncbi:GAF domain-containing protein [Sinirhodobacter sp. WL0062]|uniref:GAF domain-containing protein n=1 Tax=Rhodobacter flavimaris TaxID=2907145 RepID=A0ABS8YR36_9RHOB|nr:GAF domain-containing protein [Sinirhodobacter sp. WL0062]MCE5972346.1 GAF domain-containing protein [Sinirhodobacter sp. WL0062]